MADLPPGLEYLADVDALLLHLAPRRADGTLGTDASVQVVEGDSPFGGHLYLQVFSDKDSVVVRMFVLAQASQWVPRATLKNAAQQMLKVVQPSDEPDAYILPLFPGALDVGREIVRLDAGAIGELGILLARSGRIVGFYLPDAPSRLLPPLGNYGQVA